MLEALAEALIGVEGLTRIALAGYLPVGGICHEKLAGEWGKLPQGSFVLVAKRLSASCDLAASADALHEPLNRL